MFKKTYKRNEYILKYGDDGNQYFVIEKGVVEVIVYKENTDPND